jgi:hypothetical protein
MKGTDAVGRTPKFRAAREKQKGEVKKFSSFRAPGIPRIVGNGEIKNSFSHPKRRTQRKTERGNGKK